MFSLDSTQCVGLYPPFSFSFNFSFLVIYSSAVVNLGFRSRELSVCINIELFEREHTFHNISCF